MRDKTQALHGWHVQSGLPGAAGIRTRNHDDLALARRLNPGMTAHIFFKQVEFEGRIARRFELIDQSVKKYNGKSETILQTPLGEEK